MSSVIQVNRIYLIFNPVHFLVDSSELTYKLTHHSIHFISLPKLDIAKEPHHRKYYNYIFHIPMIFSPEGFCI